MNPRILVTRPEPGASRTASRLAVAGFEPVVLPLTHISPLPFGIPEDAYAAIVLTSAQALAGVGTDIVTRFQEKPVFAVGETTANAAMASGFGRVVAAGGAVSSIVELIQLEIGQHGSLLYLCGRVRRPDLERDLRDTGFTVCAVETYDAKPVSFRGGEIEGWLGPRPFDAVVHMSRQASELFSSMLVRRGVLPLFKDSVHVCFSGRIAEGLAGTLSRKVVTEAPTELALLEKLHELFPK